MRIKSMEEIRTQISRQEEILPEVLMAVFRIIEPHGPGSLVMFKADDVNKITGFDLNQIAESLAVLKDRDLLKTMGAGGGMWSYAITPYGREAARDLILQQSEAIRNLESKDAREKVFIIHGHDEEFKKSVYSFVQELGLRPVVLHEVEDLGRTIIEKLESEVKNARFALALWSPDDITPSGAGRARQNVILETGIFCNALTRAGVRILAKGEVEIPSDLDGVLRVLVDDEGRWKQQLVRELSAAGIACSLLCQRD